MSNLLSLSNSLPDLAARIKIEHTAVAAALRDSIKHAIAAGELLLEAKEQVPHGQWLPWLRENCGVSPRSAQGYLRLANHRGELEANALLAHLTMEEALKALAAPKKLESREPRMTGEERATILPDKGEVSFGCVFLDPAVDPDDPDNHTAEMLLHHAHETFYVMESDRHPGFYWVVQYEMYDGGSRGFLKKPIRGDGVRLALMSMTRNSHRIGDIKWHRGPAKDFTFAFTTELESERGELLWWNGSNPYYKKDHDRFMRGESEQAA
jgi:hypothetical protein